MFSFARRSWGRVRRQGRMANITADSASKNSGGLRAEGAAAMGGKWRCSSMCCCEHNSKSPCSSSVEYFDSLRKSSQVIKKLDLGSRRVSTIAGNGKAGFKDGSALEAQLSEPSGLVEAGNGRLLIADTNNSIIRFLDLNEREPRLRTLELKGVQPPVPKSKALRRLRRRSTADTEIIVVDGGSATEGKLCLQISVPKGYHLSKEAQSKFSVETEPENAASVDPLDGNINPEGSAVVQFKRSSSSPSKTRIYCKVYYCKEDEVCLYEPLMFEISFKEGIPDASPTEISLTHVVKPKSPTFTSPTPVARQ